MQIVSENDSEEMIPKSEYTELLKKYIELAFETKILFSRGLIIGLVFGIFVGALLTYLL
jgi:hypothetical protein